jgi:hypothetical protein
LRPYVPVRTKRTGSSVRGKLVIGKFSSLSEVYMGSYIFRKKETRKEQEMLMQKWCGE